MTALFLQRIVLLHFPYSRNGQSIVSNIWEHGIKVFNLHRELPLVAMTAGMGHFGPASVSNLTKDLRLQLSEGTDVKLKIKDYRRWYFLVDFVAFVGIFRL